jgi:hypothetical protein
MSIFGSIMSKIFGHGTATAKPAGGDAAGATPTGMTPGNTTPGSMAAAAGADAPSPATPPAMPEPGNTPSPPTPTATMAQVDVEAVLTEMASKNGQSLNWRTSIVDLMKLLGLDSSLGARKELAKELNYTGSTDDSASMNIWLHKQVMQKLAANGGKVPAELKD